MRRPLTTASRSTARCCLAIALLSAARLASAPSTVEMLLEGTVATLAVLAAGKLRVHNCFESRLVAVVVSIATIGGVLLAITAGAPGQASTPITLVDAGLLALAAAVLVLLEQDSRLRRGASGQIAVVVQQA